MATMIMLPQSPSRMSNPRFGGYNGGMFAGLASPTSSPMIRPMMAPSSPMHRMPQMQMSGFAMPAAAPKTMTISASRPLQTVAAPRPVQTAPVARPLQTISAHAPLVVTSPRAAPRLSTVFATSPRARSGSVSMCMSPRARTGSVMVLSSPTAGAAPLSFFPDDQPCVSPTASSLVWETVPSRKVRRASVGPRVSTLVTTTVAAPVTITSGGISAQPYEETADDWYYNQKGVFQRCHQSGAKASRSKKQVRATEYQKDKRRAQSTKDKPIEVDGMGGFDSD